MPRSQALFICVFLCFFITRSGAQSNASVSLIEDKTHFSKVFNETRHCRIILPPGYYAHPEKRYPVIYYFHGFCGRYNGPLEPVDQSYAEARYYDEFTGDFTRCGPDSLDNFSEYVKTHDVIIAKWDGFVEAHYPRPYNLAGEYIDAVLKKATIYDSKEFINYYPEFVQFVDSNYRTIAGREGRAVSGLSMGGFMSMFVASKYPHLVSSASFFCPSAGFVTGPMAMKAYTPFEEMAYNYVGLPIRMHIGVKDFLRQHNYILDKTFKTLELYYEGWHYGINYFNGFHDIVNINDQFDFHMKYFRQPLPQPEKWYHNDVYPNFEIWNYSIESDRKIPGFTLIQDAGKQGLKVTCRKWLPDGPTIPEVNIKVSTDKIYHPGLEYQVMILDKEDMKIRKEKVKSDATGRLSFNLKGGGSDAGIFLPNDAGIISMADFKIDVKMPKAGEKIALTPILFNKGGRTIDSIEVDLVSQDEDMEVLSGAKMLGAIKPGALQQQASFIIRSRNDKLDRAKLKLVVKYNGKKDQFLLEVPFFNPEAVLRKFEISDGKKFNQEIEGEVLFGQGNGDGVINPGEWIGVLTQSDKKNAWWNGLKLFTSDPYVDFHKSIVKFTCRNDGSGTMTPTSELFVKPECPKGHVIRFYGYFEFQKKGNPERDDQGSHTNVHERKRVSLDVIVGGKTASQIKK